MKIAVIGFGDIVNNPQAENNSLKVRQPEGAGKDSGMFVKADGLKLPVRLGRISSQGTAYRCLTNVLCEGASTEQVYFSESRFSNLNQALGNLRKRLGVPSYGYRNIGFVNLKNGAKRSRVDAVADRIEQWARKTGYDGVIWNDLPTKGVAFGLESNGSEVLPLLCKDEALFKNTQNYIASLPKPHNSLQQTIMKMGGPAASSTDKEYQDSLVADFAERDSWKQTNVPKSEWFKKVWGKWGPPARTFPPPQIPEGVDPVNWKRDRIIEVAKHFKGLPYKRKSDGMRGHFPERGCGLDCSNFVSWIYNYGLGIKFTSDVDSLAKNVPSSRNAGRFLSRGETLKKGDLVLFNGNPKHVVIYIDKDHIIDSTSGRSKGVQVRDVRKKGNRWCRPTWDRILAVRRPIE